MVSHSSWCGHRIHFSVHALGCVRASVLQASYSTQHALFNMNPLILQHFAFAGLMPLGAFKNISRCAARGGGGPTLVPPRKTIIHDILHAAPTKKYKKPAARDPQLTFSTVESIENTAGKTLYSSFLCLPSVAEVVIEKDGAVCLKWELKNESPVHKARALLRRNKVRVVEKKHNRARRNSLTHRGW